jgi:ABC-type nitrate/sulfonate/bicarbonate transport system permease component
MRVPTRHKVIANCAMLVLFGLLWYVFTHNQSQRGALMFPRPGLLHDTIAAQWREILIYSLTTWYRVVVGLSLGAALGVLAGLAMTYNRLLYFLIDPIVELIRPINPVALTPFFILWLGLGNASQLLLIALGCFMVMAVSTYVSISNISPIYTRAAQSLGASKPHIYRSVIIPAMMPALLGGTRVALASAFTLTVAAEYLGAQGGLGFLIRNARTILHTETIMLGAMILGLESLITDQAVRLLFSRLTRWTQKPIEM